VRRRGSALLAAVTLLAVAAALTAALAEMATSEAWIAGRRRLAAEARAAADGCVARLVASVPPGWDLAPMLAGPDGIAGTADDGTLATPPACSARATAAGARVLLAVTGSAGGGRHAVDALVGREATPGVAALVWTAAVPGAVAGTVALDGVDAGDPTAPAWSALAAPAAPDALDAWLAGEAGHVVPSADTAGPSWAPAPPLAVLGARVRGGPHGGAELLGPVPPAAPAVALVDGDLVLAAPVHGAGLLHVAGTLDIQGRLDFTGVVVAEQGLRVRGGATLAVRGAVWLGAPAAGQPLAVDGLVSVARDGGALEAADLLVALPRRPRLLGIRDPA
jgi:hypothetical protein